MGNREKEEEVPVPAREALHEPHLSAEELEQEVGYSEPWDEASQDSSQELAEDLE